MSINDKITQAARRELLKDHPRPWRVCSILDDAFFNVLDAKGVRILQTNNRTLATFLVSAIDQ